MHITFETAFKKLPSCVDVDLSYYKTVEDLRYLCQHECDLYEEGEDTACSKRDYNAIKKYMAWLVKQKI